MYTLPLSKGFVDLLIAYLDNKTPMYKYLYAFVFYLIVAGSCVLPLGSLAQQLDIIDLENMSSEVRTDPWKAYLRIANFEEQSNFDDNDEKLWFLIRKAQAENLLYLYNDFEQTLASAYQLISHTTAPKAVIELNIFSGILDRRKGNYQSAKTYFLKAMSLAQSHQLVPLYLFAKQEYAYALSLLNQYEIALTQLNEAYSLALELADEFTLAALNETYGAVYGYMKKNELSVSYYQQALQGYTKINSKPYTAEAVYGLATTYRYWKKYDLAISNFKHYLKIIHFAENSDIDFYGNYGLAMTYAEKGDCVRALSIIETALVLSGELDYKVELLKQRARCEIKLGQLTQAKVSLSEATKMFIQLPELKDTTWEIEIDEIRSDIEKELGNYQLAYELIVGYYQKRAKIEADLSDERLAGLRNTFELEKRDAKIKLLQEQAKAQALEAERNYENSIAQQYRLALLLLFALIVLIAFLWQRRNTKKFIALSITDSLSGLFNRRYIFELFEKAFYSISPENGSLYILLLDIDNFKKINDNFGHAVGDDVIRKLSGICQSTLRNEDAIGRIGGEEFLCILPRIDNQQSISIAQRMLSNISQALFTNNEGTKFNVTVSIGIAKHSKACSVTKELFLQADKALYYAKNNGKNRVVLFDDITH